MADNFASWPTVTDDDGSLTTGTPFSNAYDAAVRASVADNVYSSTNPTVKTKTIIDEVVAARGNLADLDTRITNVVDADGNPVAVAGQATVAQLQKQIEAKNLVRNGDMEMWGQGDSAAPDFWVSAGTGAQILRAGVGKVDTTVVDAGHSSANLLSGSGDQTLLQNIVTIDEMSERQDFEGRFVHFIARVRADAPAEVRLVIDDGATTSESAFHAGDSAIEDMVVTHEISGSATKLDVYIECGNTGNNAWVGGAKAFITDEDVPPAVWFPEVSRWNDPNSRVISAFAGSAANSGTSETTLWTLPAEIPSNALRYPGQSFDFLADLGLAANTNTKTIKFYVGPNSTTLLSNADSVASNICLIRLTVTYASSDFATVVGYISFGAASGAAPTIHHFAASIASPSWLGGPSTFKLTGQSDTASDDLTLVRVRLWKP